MQPCLFGRHRGPTDGGDDDTCIISDISTPRPFGPHPVYHGHSDGYTHASLVDHATGSVHTGLSIDELAPGGTLPPHVHSYEESFYVLAGEAILRVARPHLPGRSR